MTVVFDKLAFVRRLEGEGTFSRAQAEALSEAVHGAVSEIVATKSDLAELRHEIAAFRARSAEIRQTNDRHTLRSELKLWTGSLVAAQFAALSGLAAALRFLGH